jgi:hypothetical protein
LPCRADNETVVSTTNPGPTGGLPTFTINPSTPNSTDSQAHSKSDNTNVGLLAGTALAGAAGACIMMFVVFYVWRRLRRSRRDRSSVEAGSSLPPYPLSPPEAAVAKVPIIRSGTTAVTEGSSKAELRLQEINRLREERTGVVRATAARRQEKWDEHIRHVVTTFSGSS